MASTSTRVSRPEEEGVKRLVAMAGERDSGETCRWSPCYSDWFLVTYQFCLMSHLCRTYVFKKENHTLGNALRSMLLTNPQVLKKAFWSLCFSCASIWQPVCLSLQVYWNQVLFAGYTIPHPAEDQMHLRIQTAPDYLAQTALKWAEHQFSKLNKANDCS